MSIPVLQNLKGKTLAGETVLVILLLSLHAWLGLSASVEQACTADEIPHLGAGHAYWVNSAYNLHPENGILPQRWAALPALASAASPPDTRLEAWQVSDVWTLGYDYLYGGKNQPELLLLGARSAAILWSVLTGLLVFLWSRTLFGLKGSLFSLVLFTFCPAFLANGPLVTSDACATLWLLTSTAAFWRLLHHPGPFSNLLSASCLGLACVSKFNALLLFPIFLLMWGVHRFVGPRHKAVTLNARQLAGFVLTHLLITLLIIWAFHGFGSDTRPAFARYQYEWSFFQSKLGWKAGLLAWIQNVGILPDSFVYGFTLMASMAGERGAFLRGMNSVTGWWWFFPYAFLVKSTVAVLGSSLLLLLTARRRLVAYWAEAPLQSRVPERLYQVSPLLCFSLVFGATSLLMHLNIGHRHILPLYPVLYIACGWLGSRLLAGAKPARVCVVLLIVLLHAGESLRVRPHYLAFFNVLAGGPEQGHRHLVDSSLDWGQGLGTLAEWLDAQTSGAPRSPVFLAYFGMASIPHHLPKANILLSLPSVASNQERPRARPGFYCVGATMLEQAYLSPREWTVALERRYQNLRPQIEPLYTGEGRPLRNLSPEEDQLWREFETLRFMRLADWLRQREPVATPGYSILVYKLSAADIQSALEGSLSEWAK